MKKYQGPCGLYIQSLARTSNIGTKNLDDQILGLTLEATSDFLHTPLQQQSPSKSKTFTENWYSKVPSFGTLLAYLETTAEIIYVLGIQLFCFSR